MKPFSLRLDLETFRIDKTPIMIRFSGVGHISDWDHVSMTSFCRGRLVAMMEEYYFFERKEYSLQLSILDLSTSMDIERAYR